MKAGVSHAERSKNARLQELPKSLARDGLDDASKHVGRAAVVPLPVRLAEQREAREPFRLLGIGLVGARQVLLGVHALHGARTDELVCQAGCVAQKILDRDRPLRRHELDAAIALNCNLRIGEGRHVFCRRIGEE
jgi:hypothetical protein